MDTIYSLFQKVVKEHENAPAIIENDRACKRKIPRSNRMKLPREEKWMSETESAAAWASTVAAAEPRIPQPNPKMNSGLSRQFNTTAVSIIVMALLG